MAKVINLLAVCGSGTVSSTMVAEKASAYIESLGYTVNSQELNPQQASERIPEGRFDIVVYTSPIPGNFDVPVINGTGLLTGIGEEEVYSQIKKALKIE